MHKSVSLKYEPSSELVCVLAEGSLLRTVRFGSRFRKHHPGLGFRDRGSRFRVQGSGFRVQNSGFLVQGSGFRVQGSGFRVQGSGFRVQGCMFTANPHRRHFTTSDFGVIYSQPLCVEGRCKATWKREFKLPWRKAGPPNHHDDKVDSDQ